MTGKSGIGTVGGVEGFMSPGEVARRLGVSPQRVIQLANGGRLACYRTSLGRLFRTEDVEALALARQARRAATDRGVNGDA